MKTAFLCFLFLLSLVLPASAQDGQWLTFEGAADQPGAGKHIVLIAGDEEYRTEESCPMLAKILSKRFGFKTTVLFPINPEGGFVDPHFQKNIPGMEAINSADLVIIGTRFRDLPDAQIKPFADYLNAGKPVFGFRTATHGFKTANKTGNINWENFGPDILGEGWAGHYGKHMKEGARGVIHPPHAKNPILNGVGEIFAESDVYGVQRVTTDNAQVLVHGLVTDSLDPASPNAKGKDPQVSVWLREYKTPDGKPGTALCSTFGSSCDLDDEDLRRLFINAAFHLTGLKVPDKADVSYIDPFEASAYANNKTSEYYQKLNFKPADYGYGKSPVTGPPMEKLVKNYDPQAANGNVASAAKTMVRLPGPEIVTTVTTVEAQRENGEERPVYHQPKPLSNRAATKLPLSPQKGERIVFLGNSLAERMEHFGYFETLLHRTFPDSEITFRNMGYPAHTPAFRPEAGTDNPWAFPGGEKFRPEINAHHGKGHYPHPDEWLTILKADTIVAFFGFNESFDGKDGVANFKAELAAFVDHTLSHSYNGADKSPQLVLATPTAVEQHPAYHLPDAAERNGLLKLYSDAVAQVAKEKNVGLLDLFTPTSKSFATNDGSLTINGVHLSSEGYKNLAPLLLKDLFGKSGSVDEDGGMLRQAVYDKSWFWRNDYRMLNGVHAYGQRWAPYGNFNYPEEIEKIRQMTVLRDQNLWAIAQGKSETLEINDSVTRPLTPVVSNYTPSEKNGSLKFIEEEEEALSKFTLPENYEVSVFATEAQFPNLGNPCQIRFDNKGRLWVSTVKSYPHYKPGGPMPNDMLLIYEDTDGDGRADKETIFADKLHIPIGFDLAPEGVYISEEPYLTLHKDTDGDDKADTKEYLLDGFDSHDTHHAISSFDTDHGGGIFMCEGRFLHSQVETPWGPQRMTDGGTWRFDPKSWKVERVLQRDVSNPWAVTHDEYGQNFLNDASGGNQYWMLGYSVKVPHAHEISHVEKFNYEHHCRPTSGGEFLYSSHFPDELQGDYLYCNTIGFLGIKQFRVVEDGPEIKGKFRQDTIVSSDGNFRPADLELGPDGSLYFVDWHNTLIGHMQHSARDPYRNSEYGRIYRITYKGRDLIEAPDIDGAAISTLFENLKLPEINTRKRSHRELRGRDADAVIASARAFAATNKKDQRLVLEALWATWGQQLPDLELLQKCLKARDHRVRSAAVRVVRHCLHLLDEPEQYLMVAAKDPHPRVRMEALSGGSWLGGKEGAQVLLTVASGETDKWIRTSLNSAILLLKPQVDGLLSDGSFDRANIADVDKLLTSKLPGAPPRASVMTKSSKERLGKNKAFKTQYALGQKVFYEEGSCSTCHLENGLGIPNIYPPIAESAWVNDDDERLIKLVLHGLWGKITVKGVEYDPAKGVPPMTAVGAMFTDTEVAAVLTYVKNSWGNDSGMVSADQVKKIREATKGRTQFYTPDELLREHPLK